MPSLANDLCKHPVKPNRVDWCASSKNQLSNLTISYDQRFAMCVGCKHDGVLIKGHVRSRLETENPETAR